MLFRKRASLAGAAVAVLLATAGLSSARLTAAAAAAPGCAGDHWVASWVASPTDSLVPTDATGDLTPQVLTYQTLRMIVTPHRGGSSLRIHLSNRFGASDVSFGRVTVGRQTSGAAATNIVPVTFGNAQSVTIPKGQDVVSDPVALTFAAFAPLAVSMYVPGIQTPPTKHWNANATSYYSLPLTGDSSRQQSSWGFFGDTGSWLYVSGVDVLTPARTRGVVAFGDSITDGFVGATPLSIPADAAVADTNGRYPDQLQRRLDQAGIPISVVNAGIGGNQLLTGGEPLQTGPSGLARFDKDVLAQAGVAGVLVLEGINDLGLSRSTAEQLIAGYTQLIERSHAAGLKIWLATITPASNALVDGTLLAPNSETSRQQINSWIRTQTLADGFVDFDAALRDPADPSILRPAYASVDNLHPNLAGYQAMANAVPQDLLSSVTCPS
ncbi:SGNH/GDSL hydrolase family protein [Frankia sp. CNm7]|uniref:SGNH/GDSL hydrolase family protein n=1 Tax=Frankia nepalensis TaxID=1836974 RepID=A0A937RNB1_9ACTN|nr:SGNH/GDSL hydrolase family protein [Frankia nepalensis]MBL7510548.1 SGNH/GDSL hydrolase family protein [Frankia nepalensis]MBL7524700.1 SGNH/GDSL hydrolase family protein [Frankia nepalensis]MBL7633335.1 SGNH/GDSL hydrolase family protein [Frankia nepalensis]